MRLHEGLTHINSHKKPRLHFGENFALIFIFGLTDPLSKTALQLSLS